MKCEVLVSIVIAGVIITGLTVQAGNSDPIVPLRPFGNDFQNEQGEVIRLWGVNLVSLFPTHEEAENTAANLAALNINIVRPHHMLRSSRDWIFRSQISALNLMNESTRQPDPEAWDRFDYLNAQLRKRGIYLQFSLNFSRSFREGDVDIIETTPEDRKAWVAAIKEFNSWNWRKKIDPNKMMPTIDERANALQTEFAQQLLEHVNPYTGIAYGKDPQVLTVEVLNESSAEYCLICGNTYPEYFLKKLDAKWNEFLIARNVESFDFRQAGTHDEKKLRADFFRYLDETLMVQMTEVVRATGCKAAITYSNLWRGENALDMHNTLSDFIEDHAYADPLVVRKADDVFYAKSRTLLLNKPYIIGELNHAEGDNNKKKIGPLRSMLPLAMSSYGAFNSYAGLVWFSWCHGDRSIATDGWSLKEDRESHLGDMVSDGMMLDHMRTCGMIFRKGLVMPSTSPKTLVIDAPFHGTDYNSIMKGKVQCEPGWQNIHSIRKTFGTPPESQATTNWMIQPPINPLISDTGEIVKDMERQQLTVAASQVEAFSGYFDSEKPAGLKNLILGSNGAFATVVAVCADDKPFAETEKIIISRTCLDDGVKEISGPDISLSGLKSSDGAWYIKLTRPRNGKSLLSSFTGQDIWELNIDETGAVQLPLAAWHECELIFVPTSK